MEAALHAGICSGSSCCREGTWVRLVKKSMLEEAAGQAVRDFVNGTEKLRSVRQEHIPQGFKQRCGLIRSPLQDDHSDSRDKADG